MGFVVARFCVIGVGIPFARPRPDDLRRDAVLHARGCPSSVSPDAIRRGSITHYLKSDAPETAVGDRANVSQDILEKHYDRRSKREKMEQRREYLDNLMIVKFVSGVSFYFTLVKYQFSATNSVLNTEVAFSK